MDKHTEQTTLVAEFGYTDQAHLIYDLRLAVDETRGAYLRSMVPLCLQGTRAVRLVRAYSVAGGQWQA